MARLAKKYIKQAGGNLKKAWRLQKRSKGKRRSRSRTRRTRSRGKSMTRRSSKLGALISKARGADIVSGPAQGSFMGLGLSKGAAIDAANRYVGGEGQSEVKPLSNMDTLKNAYGGIVTGLAHQKLRSFLRMPQGAGQGKILSIVGQVLPELQAAGSVSPLQDPKGWNQLRMLHDRGYGADQNVWNPADSRFLSTLTGTIGLGLISRILAPMMNKHLPKGVNL